MKRVKMDFPTSFNDEFKSMWKKDSPVWHEWGVLELYYASISTITDNVAIKALALRNIADIDNDIKADASRMEELFLETTCILWNRLLLRTCFKVRDALQLLFYSSNTANSYGCALAARSIVEHVALLHYFTQKVPWRASRAVTAESMAEFIQQLSLLVQGSTFDWDKFLSGNASIRKILSSQEWKRPRRERLPHISTLVKSLDDKLSKEQDRDIAGRIQFIYSVLCDVVHPSWGGDFIYAPKMNREMQLERELDEHFKKIASLFCLPMTEITKCFLGLIEFMLNNEPKMLGISNG